MNEKNQLITGYERVENGGLFYGTSWNGDWIAETDTRDISDDICYESGNYVTDKNLVERRSRRDRLFWNLERYAVMHRQSSIDYEKHTMKYFIIYDHDKQELSVDYCYSIQIQGVIYFDSEILAQAAINEFHDELVWFFTKYRDCI